jgi:hypothetical protein
MNESDELEAARRQRDETAFQAEAPRVSNGRGQLVKPAPEPIEISFDWDPVAVDDCITFHYRVSYRSRRGVVDFTIDRKNLAQTELERLADFLVRRHAGTTSAVRQLLLVEAPSEQSAPSKPIRPGISPLLALLTKRERNRLHRSHQIEVEDLERESEQLYESLGQFAGMSETDFWPAAEAFNSSLYAHHEKVRQAGILLNNPIGNRLAREAELGIKLAAAEARKIKPRQE